MSVRADHHVALRVSDLDRAISFYEEALGGRLVAVGLLHQLVDQLSILGDGLTE